MTVKESVGTIVYWVVNSRFSVPWSLPHSIIAKPQTLVHLKLLFGFHWVRDTETLSATLRSSPPWDEWKWLGALSVAWWMSSKGTTESKFLAMAFSVIENPMQKINYVNSSCRLPWNPESPGRGAFSLQLKRILSMESVRGAAGLQICLG